MFDRTLAKLIGNPAFSLKMPEDLFAFLVALGGEEDEVVIARAWRWMPEHIPNFPMFYKLIPPFMDYLLTRFPADSLKTRADLDGAIQILDKALYGAMCWWEEYRRFGQLAAVLLAYETLLKKTARLDA